jgi:lysozyme
MTVKQAATTKPMQTGALGVALIKRFESLELTAYTCAAGKLTIGYGHVILPHESFQKITEAQAEALLKRDLKVFETFLNAIKLPFVLNQNQYDALIALMFNIGCGAFQKSTLLRLLKEGDVAGAAGQFGRFVFANRVKLNGLVRRRAAEADLFETLP